MIKQTGFATVLVAACAQAGSIKVGLISDLHLNLAYDQLASEDDNCVSGGSGSTESQTAPIGRINCDPSTTLVTYMLQRFNEAFGEVDVLLVTGDHVAHDIAPDMDDITSEAQLSEAWDAVKTNLEATAQVIEEYFPNSLVLTDIGNNDGYHSQAVQESQKTAYYGFLYDLWFNQYPGNAGIVDSVKGTFFSAGYYRVDVSDTISVLSLSDEYMDIDDDQSMHGNEATEQLDWLEAQLIEASSEGRKFIIAGHVYAGARYHGNDQWHADDASRYFQIIRDNADAIVIEVFAHDHYADLRYHSSHDVVDLPDTDVKFDFHNLFIAPGVTPNKGSQPGIAMFEVSADGVPSNLKFEFMDLYQQYGASSVSYDEVKWLSLPMSDYGVTEITATALSDFRKRLEDDDDMTREYLVRKLGFNAQDETETNMAYDVLKDKDLLSEKKLKTGEYICQMHKSTSGSQFDDCCDEANSAEFDGSDVLVEQLLLQI